MQLERVAREGDAQAFQFAVPMARQKNCDFSFSGLKTQVIRQVRAMGGVSGLGPKGVADIAASFQRTAIQHLRDRTERALAWCRANRPQQDVNLVVCG